MLGESLVLVLSLMDFTELEIQRIRSIISYKGVTLRASCAR